MGSANGCFLIKRGRFVLAKAKKVTVTLEVYGIILMGLVMDSFNIGFNLYRSPWFSPF